MQEVKIIDNPLGLKVITNGVPDIHLIPEEQSSVIIAALENQIEKHYDKSDKEILKR